MRRRTFLLGAGAVGLAACAKPERDLVGAYDGVELPLEPGATTTAGAPTTIEAVLDPTTSTTQPPTPYERLVAAVEPAEDRIGISFVAQARQDRDEVEVFANPADPAPTWRFDNPLESGDELLFLVDDYDGAGWYHVLLPTRPNGSFGWVRVDDTDLLRHNWAIRANLEEFELTLFDHREVAMQVVIGVARDNAPTPRGRYYTTELIRPVVPDSVYGAFAYGLSGFSDTFQTFAGGPGQLGIHGTNDPDTLGGPVSHGCIRMHNDDITRMVEELRVPAGVPVEVV